MDIIYLGIMAGLVLLTWGLMKICDLPSEGSSKEQALSSKQ